MKLTPILIFILLAPSQSASCQGFTNLDFEQAKIVFLENGPSPSSVIATDAIPGWTPYFGGGTPNDWINYNSFALAGGDVSIRDTDYLIHPTDVNYNGVIQGQYSLVLSPTFDDAYFQGGAIGQTGTIPLWASSIVFQASGSISVSFSGNPIPLVVMQMDPNHSVYGGDISKFAGQEGELLFQADFVDYRGGLAAVGLDNISFQMQPIPEPSAVILIIISISILRLRNTLSNKTD